MSILGCFPTFKHPYSLLRIDRNLVHTQLKNSADPWLRAGVWSLCCNSTHPIPGLPDVGQCPATILLLGVHACMAEMAPTATFGVVMGGKSASKAFFQGKKGRVKHCY